MEKKKPKPETTGPWTGGDVLGKKLTSQQPPLRPDSSSADESAVAPTTRPAAHTQKVE